MAPWEALAWLLHILSAPCKSILAHPKIAKTFCGEKRNSASIGEV